MDVDIDVNKALDLWWGEAQVAISNIAIINAYKIYRKHHLLLCEEGNTSIDEIDENHTFQMAFFLKSMGTENLKMFLAKAWDENGDAIKLPTLKNRVLKKEKLFKDPLSKDLNELFGGFTNKFEDHLKTIKLHRNQWLAHFGIQQVQVINEATTEAEETSIRDILIMSNATIVLIHRLMYANAKPRGIDPKIIELKACQYWETIFTAQKYGQPEISYHGLVPEELRTPKLTPLFFYPD